MPFIMPGQAMPCRLLWHAMPCHAPTIAPVRHAMPCCLSCHAMPCSHHCVCQACHAMHAMSVTEHLHTHALLPAAVFSEPAQDVDESHPLLLRGAHALAERYLSQPHVVKRIREARCAAERSAVAGMWLLLCLLGCCNDALLMVSHGRHCRLRRPHSHALHVLTTGSLMPLRCRSGMRGSTECRHARSSTCTVKQARGEGMLPCWHCPAWPV